MSKLPEGFSVDLSFPDEYSDFIAEVYYKDRLIFVISQEHGFQSAEIAFDRDVRGSLKK